MTDIQRDAKVIWTGPDGARRPGIIREFNRAMETHYVHLEDGDIAAATIEELDFYRESKDITEADLQRVADALDKCSTLLHEPLRTDNRARIFNAVETGTHHAWLEARGCYIRGNYTLWGAVHDLHGEYGDESMTPTREQIIEALEKAAGHAAP